MSDLTDVLQNIGIIALALTALFMARNVKWKWHD